MSYTRFAAVQKFVDNAHTKLLVYYLERGHPHLVRPPQHSRGPPGGRPRAVEIKRHERYVAKDAPHIKVALLHDLDTGEELRRFKKGEWD